MPRWTRCVSTQRFSSIGRVSPKMRKVRRCASTPSLSAYSNDFAEGGLDVYVAFRPFTEFGGALFARMPPSVKDSLLGLGIAHYMTVVRTPDGRLTQFDFGPQGGRDIHVSAGSLDTLLAQSDQPRRKDKRSVPGENQVRLQTSIIWFVLQQSEKHVQGRSFHFVPIAADKFALVLCLCGTEQLEHSRHTQLQHNPTNSL